MKFFLSRSAPTRWLLLVLLSIALAGAVTSSAAAQFDDPGLATLDAGAPIPDGGVVAPMRTAPTVTPTRPTSPARVALPAAAPTPPEARPRVVIPSAPARYEVSGGVTGSAYSIQRDFAPSADPIILPPGWIKPTQLGNAGDVGLSVGHFFSPVRDDAAPRSLQPYLQRVSRAYAGVSAGGFSTKYGTPAASTRNYSYVSVGAGVHAYVTPHFTVSGSAGYTYDVLHEAPLLDQQHTLSAAAGLGLRVGDVLVTASYRFNARVHDGRLADTRWGAAQLSAYWVFARAYSLGLGAYVRDDGGGGSVDFAAYTTKDLAIFAGVSAGTYLYPTSNTRADYYTFGLGISYWTDTMLRLSLGYGFNFTDSAARSETTPASRQYEHALSLGATLRLP